MFSLLATRNSNFSTMSRSATPTEPVTTPSEPESPVTSDTPPNLFSIEGLQNDEQRRVLDMIVQIRKCGLEGNLSLPQIVVCGDQSAGKSSVLEAITRVPFPRSDGLCTRYATEISLRRANSSSLTISILPDEDRPPVEQEQIEAFVQTIDNFDELPRVMDLAKAVMGISNRGDDGASTRAFTSDVLRIEISGPTQPQLTLVDIPGLIATSTRGVTKDDVDMVAKITDYYIKQPRTICLAVVCATNDYANQKILEKVRDVDPEGNRTLGIITKPDGLPEGSISQKNFIDLANNEDIFFKLGWHVLKNRSYEESDFTIEERDEAEATFFRTHSWNSLSPDCLGVNTLRTRLCNLLFEHIKRELPQLHDELEAQLQKNRDELAILGVKRSTATECKAYLSKMSLDFHSICKAAVNGQYEGSYFLNDIDPDFSLESSSTLSRTRAVIQDLNSRFEEGIRLNGHKYQIEMSATSDNKEEEEFQWPRAQGRFSFGPTGSIPKVLNKVDSVAWIGKVLKRTRGRELVGNFNPLLIGALFWEQSSGWEKYASSHLELVSSICRRFLKKLLHDTCPQDVETRLWALRIEPELKKRHQSAVKELNMLLDELKEYPINYNHYYTDSIAKRRQQRQQVILEKAMKDASSSQTGGKVFNDNTGVWERPEIQVVDTAAAIANFTSASQPDMNEFACEEVLDCLFAIYKVLQKTFVANVTTQVIERHIVRGLENIFSPVTVNDLEPAQAEALALEPAAAGRHRAYLEDLIKKLEEGHEIFQSVM
ncbi:dynamin family protein-like protein [Mollisia scopiformis]|uniref:Dynamin family protein-like protein n=1 Tax=Mollisia scopiformis TaxID=149040 RepID=A0A194XEM2_MOLSC|nr:dynamin family protein-like protein [Mollisia scopiformis]KUJ18596.1 dynamin family protein-like protein [Mollisia scopiformis]